MNDMLSEIFQDFKEAWGKRELWFYSSVMETKQRYRRSVLGPFWISLSIAIMILSIGILWSKLWKISLPEYLPYFTVGLLLWTFISAIITESTFVFTRSVHIIKQVKLPFFYYIFNLIWKNVVIFTHHLIVYIIVIIYFKVNLSASILLFIPGLLLYFLTALWVVPCLGILCTRFRDVEQLIPSILTILFFMTPIIWKMGWSGKEALFVYLNPLYHYIEIMRGPMLGYTPTMTNYLVVFLIAIIGMSVASFIINKYKNKISYWI